ncbi:MAG: NAD(P)/FAD-dependent oxidoreductase [Candidatus Pacebacteria bacterium]|nr:NAD(P)/FAD-dependent oxidoreductase [Candidatus Paceibacterota bacterium]
MDKKPHIVIVGAGFGGVYAAKHLVSALGDAVEITLINRDNYFLFTPLLHEVATGSLSHQSVVEPIAEIFRGTHVHFAQTEVHRIDFDNKSVEAELRTFPYDYLIVASGAKTNVYGIPGVAEHSIMLKTLSDALSLRKRIIETIKTASHTNDPAERKHLLSFVIVGGGPTGVELTAELSEFVQQVAKSYYSNALHADEISVTLIASGADLVPQFSPQVRARALSVLKGKSIEILLGTSVTEIMTDGVSTKDARGTRFIPAGTVVWVAGVEATLPDMVGEAHMHKSGRLMVDEFLQVQGHTGAFAIGDGAIPTVKEGEMPVPQLAQSAVQEAKVVAKNIAALIESSAADPRAQGRPVLSSFVYHSKGMLISLGSWQAAGDIFGFHPSGPVMWFMWRTTYLFKFIPWRKRFSIVVEWTINLFSPRDISEV